MPDEVLDRVTAADRISLWTAVLADDSRVAIGAYDAGTPVGFVMAGPPLEPLFDGMDGQIPAFYIRASHHRRGIGRRLLGAAAGRWLAQGGRSLALGVLSANAPAIAFYETMGARRVRDDVYVWDGHPLDERIYVFENLGQLARFA